MRCIDVTQNRRDIAVAAVGSDRERIGSDALVDRHERQIFGAGVVRRRANQLVVDALFDDMRAPTGGARDHEQRREHRGGNAEHVVRDRAEPIEVGEHLLGVGHRRLDPVGDVEQLHRACRLRKPPRDLLDHLVARIGDRIDGVAEADDHLAVGDPPADVRLRFIGRGVAALDVERDLVGAAMLGSAQRADARGDRRIHVRAGAGDHAAGEGRGVELVFGVENERGVHGADEHLAGRPAVQQMQEVAADRSRRRSPRRSACRCARSGTSRAAPSRGRPSADR